MNEANDDRCFISTLGNTAVGGAEELLALRLTEEDGALSPIKPSSSYLWRSVLKGRVVLKKGLGMNVLI